MYLVLGLSTVIGFVAEVGDIGRFTNKLGPFTTLVHGTLLPYDKKRFTPHITVIRKAEYRNGRFLSWKLPEAV